MTLRSSRILPPIVFPLALALAALTHTTPAQAGPTAAADLDLGTSIKRDYRPDQQSSGLAPPSALYVAGFRIRAGWRFVCAPVWPPPEIGGGYAVEPFPPPPGILDASDVSLP